MIIIMSDERDKTVSMQTKADSVDNVLDELINMMIAMGFDGAAIKDSILDLAKDLKDTDEDDRDYLFKHNLN